MTGNQYVDISRVIACIQKLKTLIAAPPLVNQGGPIAENISYYSKIYYNYGWRTG